MTTQPTLVALDIGYGYTKASTDSKFISFPSVIGIAENIRYGSHLLDGQPSPSGIQLHTPEGDRFIGDLALRQSRVKWTARDRRRTETHNILTFALAALSELDVSGPVQLVTGLPVKWYQPDKAALQQQLTGTHTIQRAGRPESHVEITDVLVTIQPFGALFSVIFNPAGRVINPDVANGQIGLIDIGTYTTDFIVAHKGQYIEPASDSTTTAMAKLYELTASAIDAQFDHHLSLHETDKAIRAGAVTVRGQRHPLAPIVEPILQGIADDILATVATTWADHESSLDTILVAGGGAETIGPYLANRFPHLAILPSGAMANVSGYYRYGLFKWPQLRPDSQPSTISNPSTKRKRTKARLNGVAA